MFQKFGLIFFGILCGIIGAELLVRVLDVAPKLIPISIGRFRYSNNPLIGYEPIPNFEYSGKDLWYFEFRGKSNSLGFRDQEHLLEKDPQVWRILVLGDSVTMGLYIPKTENVFTSVLEKELILHNFNVEVLNFGVSGYNTQQEVALLEEKGLVFHPDIVILQYCLNDRSEVNGGIVEKLLKKENNKYDVNLFPPYLRESALYRFVAFNGFAKLFKIRLAKRQKALDDLKKDTVEQSFLKLRHLSNKHGFLVIVVFFPDLTQLSNALLPEYTAIEQLSESNGFYFVNLREALKDCELDGKVSLKDPHYGLRDPFHPTPYGHQCAGKAIARFLGSNIGTWRKY